MEIGYAHKITSQQSKLINLIRTYTVTVGRSSEKHSTSQLSFHHHASAAESSVGGEARHAHGRSGLA